MPVRGWNGKGMDIGPKGYRSILVGLQIFNAKLGSKFTLGAVGLFPPSPIYIGWVLRCCSYATYPPSPRCSGSTNAPPLFPPFSFTFVCLSPMSTLVKCWHSAWFYTSGWYSYSLLSPLFIVLNCFWTGFRFHSSPPLHDIYYYCSDFRAHYPLCKED